MSPNSAPGCLGDRAVALLAHGLWVRDIEDVFTDETVRLQRRIIQISQVLGNRETTL